MLGNHALRFLANFSIVLAVIVVTTVASAEPYTWTISASATDPYVQTAVPQTGFYILYVWMACATWEWRSGLFLLDGTLLDRVVGTAEIAPYHLTNGGGGLLIASDFFCDESQVPAPVAVAQIFVNDLGGTGGNLCLTGPGAMDRPTTQRCGPPAAAPFLDSATLGFANDGSNPCNVSGNCPPDFFAMPLDIVPATCPNEYSCVDSLRITIPGISGGPAVDIDPHSILLSGPGGSIVPDVWVLQDVTRPQGSSANCDCDDTGSDQRTDLTLIFDPAVVEAVIGSGEEEYCVSGLFTDDRYFEACDCLEGLCTTVSAESSIETGSWGRIKSGYRD